MLISIWESFFFFSYIKFSCLILSLCLGFIIICTGRRRLGKKNDAKHGNLEKDLFPVNDDNNPVKPKLKNQLGDDDINRGRKKSKSNNDDGDGSLDGLPLNNKNFENELDMTQTHRDNDSDEISDKNRNRSNKKYSSKKRKGKLKTCLKSPNTSSEESISHKKVSFNEKVKIRVVESEDVPSLRTPSNSNDDKTKSSLKLNRLRMKKKS